MMRVRARRQPEEAEIIIIPMIDTMMFLLMFFIVASPGAGRPERPAGEPAESRTGQKHSAQNVTITISAAGDMHLNTRPITLTEETADLKALGVTAGTLVVINADKESKHGTLIPSWTMPAKPGPSGSPLRRRRKV